MEKTSKSKKPSRTFNRDAPLTAAPVAAAYLGIPSGTLLHAAGDTLCLNEFQVKSSGRVFYHTEQLILHQAHRAVYGYCAGDCKSAAVKAIQAARQIIAASTGPAINERIM